jgi:flavin-dependent dehydrogenase
MNFDQVIIGASTSGLFAAKLLAEAGQRVAVFDQQATQNPARRTYIITPQLKPILGFIPEEALLHTIDTMVVETPQAEVEIQLKDPDLIIERNRLSHTLARMAEKAGAAMFWGYRFLEFVNGQDRTSLCFLRKDGEVVYVEAKTVIGADGLFSDVGKAAGIEAPPFVPILQAEVKLPRNWDPSVTKVWFDVLDTPYFYWLIPETKETGVAGLVGDNQSETRKLLDGFLTRHNLRAIAYQGGVVAMHHRGLRPWGTIGDLLVLLIGDAAGQVKVSTVGGTVTGFWGAQAAVKTILEGTSYKKNLGPLKRELDLHWYMRALLERLDNPGYDQLVESITKPVQSFLGDRNRDQMAGAFWKLPFIQPRLLLVGLRCIFGTLQYENRRRHRQVSIAD